MAKNISHLENMKNRAVKIETFVKDINNMIMDQPRKKCKEKKTVKYNIR